MNRTTLDLDTLRTLVAANDLGGYGQAAARLGRTPSAISLQMKRLQEDVGAPLFRKDGRGIALTEAGAIALGYGRRMLALNDELLDSVRGASLEGTVRLGFSQDFAGVILPSVLAQFSRLYPLVVMEVRIEGNAALVQAVEKGQLDLALTVGYAERPSAQCLGELPLVWIAGREFTPRAGQPLPLAAFGPQCAFRKTAIEKLDQAGVAWRIAAVSPSLGGLWAAALGGLGVIVRMGLELPDGLVHGKSLFGLPELGSFPITLHSRLKGSSKSSERLRTIIAETVAAALPGRRKKRPPQQISPLR